MASASSPPSPLVGGGGWGGEGPPSMPWITFVEEPDRATAMADAAIMALRLAEGLSLEAFARRFGCSFDEAYGDALVVPTEAGLLERGGGRVRLTHRGRLLANEVFARIMAAGHD